MPVRVGELVGRLGALLVRRVATFGASLSLTGSVVGLLAFAASTSPSLIPRGWVYQGVISGASLAVGYAAGTTARAILTRFSVPTLGEGERRRRTGMLIAAVGAVLVVVTLITGTHGQRKLAELWGLEATPAPHLVSTLVLSLGLAFVLLVVARGLRRLTGRLRDLLARWLPRAVAGMLSLVVIVAAIVGVVTGLVEDVVLGGLTASFTSRDATTRNGVVQPQASERSGSPDSLQDWSTLGFEGRNFAAGGPTPEQIEEFTGEPALEPIRVYGGLASQEGPLLDVDLDELAQEVVAELDRTNAWDREVLAVVTTTGTGWVDPAAATALEYLHGGDTAIAAMQYSVNPSWVTLVLDTERPVLAGQALFDAVQTRWAELPEDTRPELVSYGVSLGSYGSQGPFTSLEDVAARSDGAVWTGTPRFTQLWSTLTAARDAGTPEIHPVLDGGENVRWATQNTGDQQLDLLGPAGTPRIAYVQHPSDGVVWWTPSIAWERHDWFTEPPGQDVVGGIHWWPVISFLQLTGDMFLAGSLDVPMSFGHNYGEAYVDAWAWVTPVDGWTAEDSERLREIIRDLPRT